MDAQNYNDIYSFDDIIFKKFPSENYTSAKIDMGFKILVLSAGQGFWGDGKDSWEVQFWNEYKEPIPLNKVFNDDMKKLQGMDRLIRKYAKNIKDGSYILGYADKDHIMSIINAQKSNIILKKPKMIISLEEISKNLVDSAMKSGEERIRGLETSKELLEKADEDNISKNEKEIIEAILLKLITQERATNKEKTEKSKTVDVEDINIESIEDICALNTLLDDVFEVDDVSELNKLLDCELSKL